MDVLRSTSGARSDKYAVVDGRVKLVNRQQHMATVAAYRYGQCSDAARNLIQEAGAHG
jgi:ribosomal protein L18E